MSQTYDIAGFRAALGPIRVEDNPVLMRQKSRDFYWYSPVLKRQLDHVCADLIVTPQNESEIVAVLKEAHRLGIPITPRGAGTGNYGQAMPLSGGIVLNLADMNHVKSIARGRTMLYFINGHLMSVLIDDHPTMFVDHGVLSIQLEGRGDNTASFRNLWLKNLQ